MAIGLNNKIARGKIERQLAKIYCLGTKEQDSNTLRDQIAKKQDGKCQKYTPLHDIYISSKGRIPLYIYHALGQIFDICFSDICYLLSGCSAMVRRELGWREGRIVPV